MIPNVKKPNVIVIDNGIHVLTPEQYQIYLIYQDIGKAKK
jgi:hypothetical protein